MNRATQVGFLGGIAVLTLTGVGYGETGNAEINDLKARLAAAEAKIASLQATGGEQWLTEARADEIRGLVYDVLADADTRASLLQGGASAGYQQGFVINSADGNFSLRMNGLLQARAVMSQQDTTTSAFDSSRFGFEDSRARLTFSGHAMSPSWTYRIEADYGDNLAGGSALLLDAYVRYDYGNGWSSTIGQYTSPLLRESMVHSGHQLAVDRSLMEFVFNFGLPGIAGAIEERTQGVMIGYDQDDWRFMASYSDGLGVANSPAAVTDTEYAFGGRFEYKFAGNWEQFADFTSPTGEETGFLVGFAGHFEESEYGLAGAAEIESFTITVDAQWEGGGANVYGAFVYNTLDDDTAGAAAIDFDAFGFLLQGGYNLADDFEVFGRYEFIDLDRPTTGPFALADDSISIFTIGFNKYFSSHQVKWTTDFQWAFDTINAGIADPSKGWRADQGTEDGQWNIRTQVQLMF